MNKEQIIDCLNREIFEEIGKVDNIIKVIPLDLYTSQDEKFEYHTFACIVENEFIPQLNHEHKGFCWTTLDGIPDIAWEYKIGNRSALEWVLNQYKEKKQNDKTLIKYFDDYKFANHRDEVISLLKKICTVSIETMKIMNVIKDLPN